MTCEHQGTSGVSPCSISCCQRDVHSFVASILFVLPAPLLLSRSLRFVTPLMVSSEREIRPEITPPDRPPRLLPS